MAEYLYDCEDILIPWVEARISGMQFAPEAKAIGKSRDEEIIACVVFHNFTPTSCSVAVASNGEKDWLSREYLERIFSLAFVQYGVERITAIVDADNLESLSLARGVGFIEEVSPQKQQGATNYVLAMARDECRYLNERNFLYEKNQ